MVFTSTNQVLLKGFFTYSGVKEKQTNEKLHIQKTFKYTLVFLLLMVLVSENVKNNQVS